MVKVIVRRDVDRHDQLPLPGHYGVLTAQLNYTRYHPAGTCRWVMVLREPITGTEIDRVIMDLGDDTEETDTELIAAVSQMLLQCLYLQTGLAGRPEATPPN